MKKVISVLALALAVSLPALAEETLYTGSVTKAMTIREKQSTSARKLGSVEEGEFVSIIEYGDKWTLIEKDGTTGYVLSKNVEDLALAEGYNDAADAQYLGVATKQLTLRKTQSKSAQKMNTFEEGETVYILELGEEWHKVVKNGVQGYVLADPITGLQGAHEGIEVPEQFMSAPAFEAVYSAMADVNLSIRRDPDENSRLMGTVYKNEYVDVMSTDGKWAHVRKNDAEGYVRADHLRYYKRYDPYGPLIPGAVWYPYAAHVLQDTIIFNEETGEELRTVKRGSVMVTSALDENMAVTLPYDRITGTIQATGNLEFEPVKTWEDAENGDLIAVFSTYYDPAQETQEQIGRLHNIMQGVERLDGVIVPAGEKFYFNDYCAPYTAGNGYKEGPIINYVSSDKLGYGGGICQVSTTLYNAILQVPIEVIKQQVHSSYGIEYAPLDFDAAVGNGNIDLRLRNTLPYDVRFSLQAVEGVLTVAVYRAS
ncbi:MAG: VanW family protein [Christensenellales bacterium]|nr:VanW family protein [Christensenellales bacterium]